MLALFLCACGPNGSGQPASSVQTSSSATQAKEGANIAEASVAQIPDQPYTNKAIEPKVEVRLNNKELRQGTDYELEYENNTDVGKATVTVRGIGDYSGTKTATFRIAFSDVAPTHWAYDVVHRANDLKLVDGNGYKGDAGKFGPEDKITRGQAVTILWHMAGDPEPGTDAKQFSDVMVRMPYTDAIGWAAKAGVASGYADGNFGPEDPATREQLATMIANYARNVAGKEVAGSADDYKAVKDANKVSKEAETSVGWCFKNNILPGTEDGLIEPQGNATRAEAVKMFVSLHDMA